MKLCNAHAKYIAQFNREDIVSIETCELCNISRALAGFIPGTKQDPRQNKENSSK